jgi:hypothetical protein
MKNRFRKISNWFKLKYYEYRITSADIDHGMLGDIDFQEYEIIVNYYSKKIDELK